MQIRRFAGVALSSAIAAGAGAFVPSAGLGQEDGAAVGAKLYVSQCKICHGSISALDQDQAAPALQRWQLVRLAMQHGTAGTRTDALSSLAPAVAGTPDRLAFAPPFGPHLRGIYGRAAGTVEGFQYSTTFIKTLKGMEWNEAALDVWITDPQSWVPGVYMFYKQRDPEARRNIIEYLKAAR